MASSGTIPNNQTPAPGWIGGFSTSNSNFAYPQPDLSALPILSNMDNILRLTRQVDVLWPEFFWNTTLGDSATRCFQQFAPDISRAGYDDGGRIWSIICPQQGAYSPLLGSLNIEVTVTGQRGWIDETANPYTDLLAIDLNVVGKVWFAPSAADKPLYKLLRAFLESEGLPFPLSKEYAIQIVLHKVGDPNQPTIPVRSGLYDGGFTYPPRAVHNNQVDPRDNAWGVANLQVEIGSIVPSNNSMVDTFNSLVMEIFNVVSGNVLLQGNTLTWNVWFDAPTHVKHHEWKHHAKKWRESIDTGHCYPDGQGTAVPYYYDEITKQYTDFSAIQQFTGEVVTDIVDEAEALAGDVEKLVEWEWKKISAWLSQHFDFSLSENPRLTWASPLEKRAL